MNCSIVIARADTIPPTSIEPQRMGVRATNSRELLSVAEAGGGAGPSSAGTVIGAVGPRRRSADPSCRRSSPLRAHMRELSTLAARSANRSTSSAFSIACTWAGDTSADALPAMSNRSAPPTRPTGDRASSRSPCAVRIVRALAPMAVNQPPGSRPILPNGTGLRSYSATDATSNPASAGGWA